MDGVCNMHGRGVYSTRCRLVNLKERDPGKNGKMLSRRFLDKQRRNINGSEKKFYTRPLDTFGFYKQGICRPPLKTAAYSSCRSCVMLHRCKLNYGPL